MTTKDTDMILQEMRHASEVFGSIKVIRIGLWILALATVAVCVWEYWNERATTHIWTPILIGGVGISCGLARIRKLKRGFDT